MKKKLLLLTFLAVIITCILAISANADTIYKKSDGEELFRYTAGDNWVFTSYSGSFPKTDASGNPLTWYIVSTTTDGSNKIHTVDCKITLGEAGKIDANGAYSFTSPVTNKNTVSVNFPDNAGIKKFAFNSFGGYNTHSSNNLLFAYCPNTITEFSVDTFQDTDVLVVELDDETPIKTIGYKMFYNARNVRVINIPASVELIDSDNDRNGATFAYTYSLKTVTFPSNSKLTRICPYAFYDSNIEEIRFPDSLVAVNANLFRGCKNLKVIRFSAKFQYFENVDRNGNVSTGHQSLTHTATGITEIYLPETFYTSKPSVNYRVSYAFDGADNAKFYFTGTAEQLKTSIENFRNSEWTTGATDNNNIGDAYDAGKVVTWEEYSKNKDNYQGRYIIVEYNKCDAFYEGEHTNVDTKCETADACGRACGYEVEAHTPTSIVVSYEKYTEAGKRVVTCDHEGCLGNGEFTLEPIFVTKGYSIKENNGYGIISTYVINDVALKEYEDLNGPITFGIIMANANFDGQSAFMSKNDQDKYVLNSSYGVQLEIKNRDYSKVNATIDQFTQDEASLNLVMALYVIEGDKVSYIQHEAAEGVEYAGSVKKDATLDIVTITNIAEINKIKITLPQPAVVPAGNDEE